ncbi:MAG: hypothetical protein N2749_04500 [Clostridia bacterium]|nr:hypothetical protein [Clostridia bacterium]
MVAEKNYYDYNYENGSAVRKAKPEYKKSNLRRDYTVVQTPKKHISTKTKAKTVIWIVSMFVVFLVVTYRFNLINEKNLKVQNLKKDLTSAQSILASSQIEVEQSVDINQVEAYAKQKLGMQKPDKNQIIYVDNSNSEIVQNEASTTVVDKVIDKIKQVINQIF